ncbi:hypothetical protein KAR34_01300 [bacterium]|nr:hypothetical protein [bacterium]
MQSNATIRGTIIKGIIDIIEKRFGRDGVKQLMENLTPAEQTFLVEYLKNDSRVPAETLCNLYNRIKELWGEGQKTYYSELMQEIAEQNINTFLKFLISWGLPSIVANSVPNIYKYYFNQGQVFMVSNTNRSIEFYIKGGEAYGEALCAGIIGWGRQGLAMAGAKNVQVDHTNCIYHGKERCYFKVHWE